MIRLFNVFSNNSIKIDENDSNVTFTVDDYSEKNQHVKIMLQNFNLNFHSVSCNDCKALLDSFGTYSKGWYIEYLDKTRRLNLEIFSDLRLENHCIHVISDFFTGTELKLNLDLETLESLNLDLQNELSYENYENCRIIQRKITDIK